jgi:diadenosine tetraphosphatase ApaH/serine/threonine PP2A family protein phosphatase
MIPWRDKNRSKAVRAILGDIHGNLEALDAVLADSKSHGATEIYCVGDLVGYGPDSIACIERALEWNVVTLGNHDEAAVSTDKLEWWSSPSAKKMMLAVNRNLTAFPHLMAYLQSRPDKHEEGRTVYLHGSPRDPRYDYLYPEHVNDIERMNEIAKCFDQMCFCGNTHLPGIFVQSSNGRWTHQTPEECDHQWTIDERKTICNVGSVGQSRDDNPLACYVLLDGQEITFRRVEYEIAITAQKIKCLEDFDEMFAERLWKGR